MAKIELVLGPESINNWVRSCENLWKFWIATRRFFTLRSSLTFVIGGATALVLTMSGIGRPDLRANHA
jgi:hypothetical protein